jgi:hypothetical protein
MTTSAFETTRSLAVCRQTMTRMMSMTPPEPTVFTIETCFGPTQLRVLKSGDLRAQWEMDYPGVTKRPYSVRVDLREQEFYGVSHPTPREQVITRDNLRIKYAEQPDHEFHRPSRPAGWGSTAKPDPWKEVVKQINAELRPQVLAWKAEHPVEVHSELIAYAQVELGRAQDRLTEAQQRVDEIEATIEGYRQEIAKVAAKKIMDGVPI